MVDRHDSDDSIDQIKPIITASINNGSVSRSKQGRSASLQPMTKTVHKLDSVDKKIISKSKATTSYNKLKETATNVKNMVAKDKKTSAKGDSKNKTNQSANNRNPHHHYKHFISHYNSEKQQKAMQQQYFSPQQHQGLNISMDFRVKTDENGDKSILEEKSNLFLYLDLHGHA